MYSFISQYMNNLTRDQVEEFALKNDVQLTPQELDFTYAFVKKNWEKILQNPNLLNLDRYKNQFSKENFVKIERLFTMYYQKYGYLL